MPQMFKLNYPIETPEALTFWASKHKCNKVKSIIAFSLDLKNANHNLKRAGFSLKWRQRALNNFGMYVNKPDMKTIPFSNMDTPWWKCMPNITPPATRGVWVDSEIWVDNSHWTETV